MTPSRKLQEEIAKGKERARQLKPKKEPKYRNRPVRVDGMRFDSKREAQRWQTLVLLCKAGEYRDLERQKRHPLHAPNGAVVGHYVSDFDYVDCITGATITEDVKGVETDIFKWKRRHFEAEYGRKIRVTR